MIININWLEEQDACEEGIEWFVSRYTDADGVEVVKALLEEGKSNWANWLLTRIMTYKQYVTYAVYAAELALPKWEARYPDDSRPRMAIEAARRCIAEPTQANKAAAWEAARAAEAAEAAWAARAAARAAAWAAEAAARAGADLADIVRHGIAILEEDNNG